MSRTCVHCGKEIVNHGSICDLCRCGGEVIKSFWTCSACGTFYYSEYSDCWDSNEPGDVWFEVSKEAFMSGISRIAECPEPSKKLCSCRLHPFTIDYEKAARL